MFDKSIIEERRQHRRFRVKDRVVVMFCGPDSRRKIGEVIDICAGGISFRYLNYEENPYGKISSDNLVELEIIADRDGYSLGKVAVKTISDSVISQTSSLSFVALRRCRMQFKELTLLQKEQLEDFIRGYSIE